ncbi:MAG TPA: hypothetical protein VGQ24_02855, partial [Gemmatimonadales bacterium]|nr:hypothetical protein [Gemmatimonadales bacterium]
RDNLRPTARPAWRHRRQARLALPGVRLAGLLGGGIGELVKDHLPTLTITKRNRSQRPVKNVPERSPGWLLEGVEADD